MPASCSAWMRSRRMATEALANSEQAVADEDDARMAADARSFAESAHKRAVPEYAAATSGGTSNIFVATSSKDVSRARAASSWPRPTSPPTWRSWG